VLTFKKNLALQNQSDNAIYVVGEPSNRYLTYANQLTEKVLHFPPKTKEIIIHKMQWAFWNVIS